jgi:hypothetical protein
MPSGAYNENAYENAVLEVLRSMKWDCLFGPDIERDALLPKLMSGEIDVREVEVA